MPHKNHSDVIRNIDIIRQQNLDINEILTIDINKINSIIVTPNVVTNQPTQITDKTAILNGTVNSINGVANTYFEYGTTQDLKLFTSVVEQSLVGTFIKNVLDLTPKTNYFFRACAKVNNIALCGDIVSFMTN